TVALQQMQVDQAVFEATSEWHQSLRYVAAVTQWAGDQRSRWEAYQIQLAGIEANSRQMEIAIEQDHAASVQQYLMQSANARHSAEVEYAKALYGVALREGELPGVDW